MQSTKVFLFYGVLLAVTACVIGVSPASDSAGLAGEWEGFVSVTPATLWRISARFEQVEAGWQGTIDVPGAAGIPLKRVGIENLRVRFELEMEGEQIVFEGALRGGDLTGSVALGGETYPFDLHYLPELPRPENRVETWNQDLDAVLDRFLKYDRSFAPQAQERFRSEIAELRTLLPKKNDQEIIVALSRAVALSGNAHTRLYLLRNRTELRRLPIRTYWFRDGLYVIRATDEHRDTLRCRIVAIGGEDPLKIKRQVAPLFAGNESWLEYKSPFFMTSPEILRGLGVVANMESVEIRFACGDDKTFTRTLRPLPLDRQNRPTEPWWDLSPLSEGETISALQADDPALPMYLKNPRRHYWFEYLEPHKTLYFQYNRSQNMPEGERFAEFAKRLLQFVDGHPVARFIVDLRFNTGGNNQIAAGFMERLAQREKEGKIGKLFVIVGRSTFSAGISHAAHLKQFSQAIFVGEPIGDELDTWSEGGNVVLPNSRLTVHFTNGFHSLSNVKRPELEPYYRSDLDLEDLDPDVVVGRSADDYFSGRDPALEAALSYELK